MELKVSTTNLRAQVKRNREVHITSYKAAMATWQEAMTKYSQKLNVWAMAGGNEEDKPSIPCRPYNRVGVYDNYFSKLTWHQDDYVVLSEQEFDILVNDKYINSNHRGMFLSGANIRTMSCAGNDNEDMPPDHVEIPLD